MNIQRKLARSANILMANIAYDKHWVGVCEGLYKFVWSVPLTELLISEDRISTARINYKGKQRLGL